MFFDLFRSRPIDELVWELKVKKFPVKDSRNFGGKCIMPQIILSELIEFEVPAPYTFEIINSNEIFKTNCGVIDFTAEDLEITIPRWMYQQLELDSSDKVILKHKALPKGTYLKLLPHSEDFLEIDNPKHALEQSLRDYQVLTQGDEIICVLENTKIRFTVAALKPSMNGVYIVDTDLEVEFLPPIGYEEKLQGEKSVIEFLKIYNSGQKPRRIRMTKPGLFFEHSKL